MTLDLLLDRIQYLPHCFMVFLGVAILHSGAESKAVFGTFIMSLLSRWILVINSNWRYRNSYHPFCTSHLSRRGGLLPLVATTY